MTTTEAPTLPDMDVMGRLMDWYSGGMTMLMVDLGHRCGLFASAAGAGPLSSADLAGRAGCDERYVREWLGAMTTAGLFAYDPTTGTYELPAGVAPLLAGDHPLNMGPIAGSVALLGRYVEPVAGCVREGGGVPYEAFRPAFTCCMDSLGRTRYDAALVDEYVPVAPALREQLVAGVEVADIGCGTGHTTNLLARAFPASRFVGVDLAGDAIEAARAEAAAWGLENVAFEVADVLDVPAEGRFGAVFAFDCIHDQVAPAAVLSWVERALAPGGTFFMVDIAASSRLEHNIGNPLAPAFFASSVLHCMTVSLAHGGAGLGAMWGEELACSMLADAGLGAVEVHRVASDPVNAIYLASRPG